MQKESRQVNAQMGQNVTLTGIVMSAVPIGEYDKRIMLLTKERGKITAFARGARKPNHPLMAATNPFSFGEFEVFEGRSSYNIRQASISNYFMEVREDLERVAYGLYFIEVADYYTRENNDEVLMLKLLYQSLRALSVISLSKELVRYIYEIKTMVINGEYPEVFECPVCHRELPEGYYSRGLDAVVCTECRKGADHMVKVSPPALYALQYIITADIQKLYTFTVTEEVKKELGAVSGLHMAVHIDKKFHSLELLENL